MLDVVARLFTRRDPHRDAVLGLARIISHYDMVNLSYDQGITTDRRDRFERPVAIGVWLFPCNEISTADDLYPSQGIRAVTHGLRSGGIGIMSPIQLRHRHFFVAMPEEEGQNWRVFKCEVKHNTAKPGGWFYAGLYVDRTIQLEGDQRIALRQYITKAEAESMPGVPV